MMLHFVLLTTLLLCLILNIESFNSPFVRKMPTNQINHFKNVFKTFIIVSGLQLTYPNELLVSATDVPSISKQDYMSSAKIFDGEYSDPFHPNCLRRITSNVL